MNNLMQPIKDRDKENRYAKLVGTVRCTGWIHSVAKHLRVAQMTSQRTNNSFNVYLLLIIVKFSHFCPKMDNKNVMRVGESRWLGSPGQCWPQSKTTGGSTS